MDLAPQQPYLNALIKAVVDAMGAKMGPMEARLEQLCAAGEMNKLAAVAGGPNCPTGTCGLPGQPLPPGGACCPTAACVKALIPLMQAVLRERCDFIYTGEDVCRVAAAISDGSWQLFKDQVGRTEMSFQLTNAVGTGTAQTTPPQNTIFVAGPTIAANRSLLLVQDPRYQLPWRPGCLDVDLTPANGVSKEQAYSNVLITAWVALRTSTAGLNTTNPADPVGDYGVRWQPYQVIRGKELYCGDTCKAVQLRGSCIDNDWVGKDAILYLQIDNRDAANSVTFVNAEIGFLHMKKVCCDECAQGGTCNCGG